MKDTSKNNKGKTTAQRNDVSRSVEKIARNL